MVIEKTLVFVKKTQKTTAKRMNAAITNPINLVIIIIGAFLGISLSLFLLFNESAKNRANLYLGALVLVITSYFIPAFLFRFDLLAQFPHSIGTQAVMQFLIGPLTYLYVRACTQKGFKMSALLCLHFLPFGFDLLYNIPFFIQGGEVKYAYYIRLITEGEMLNPYYVIILKTIHATIYFALAARLVFQYKKHLSNTASSIDTTFHRWVLFFLAILSMPVLGLMGFVFTEFQSYTVLIFLLSLFLFLIAVYVATLVKPELFHAFPHQMALPESSEEQKQKYENSKLQDRQKDKYVEKLQAYVVMKKPYQEPELTLSQLSEKTDIPAHYLSQVINEKLDCSFLDFINGYRVKDAQEKLVSPRYSHYTILAIAYEAGFNSKSTFYAVFKKQTSMTPSAFRKGALVA